MSLGNAHFDHGGIGHLQKDRIDRRIRLIKDLKEMFQNYEQHARIIYDDIFFLNGKDKNDAEINRLKTKLVEVAFRQKSWGKRMPMAWVPLDLQLNEMRSHNTTLISKEYLKSIDFSVIFISSIYKEDVIIYYTLMLFMILKHFFEVFDQPFSPVNAIFL
jgi:hypothetical protein